MAIKVLLGWLALWSVSAQAEWHWSEHAIMGTRITLGFWLDGKTKNSDLIQQQVLDELNRIDQTYSPYKETSELSKLNRQAAGSAQVVSNEMLTLVSHALLYGEKTEGAFDITYASVGWKYDYRNKVSPKKQEIKNLLPAIDFRHVKLNEAKQTIAYDHKNVRIDLGGIAKGYAVDRAAVILQKNGIKHASISAGGDTRILGDKRGRPWVIGIKNPRGENSVIRIPIEDAAVSTSGDYERFYIDEQTGERVHHIINPKTGKSAGEVMSVTIIGPQGLDTDPLSTAVFVMGIKRGLALVETMDEFSAIIIDRDGKVHYSY